MRWKLLDRIDSMIPGQSAAGRKAVTETEDYFQHHFEELPIVPAVLMVESVAQLAGQLILYTCYKTGRIVQLVLDSVGPAHFYKVVRPGSCMMLNVELADLSERSATIHGEIEVDDLAIASVTVTFSVFAQRKWTDQGGEQIVRRLRHLWDGCDL